MGSAERSAGDNGCAIVRWVSAVPYRSVESIAIEEELRLEEGACGSFVSGDECRACGGPGARPARPIIAHGFDAKSRAQSRPLGRIALCASCVAQQDRFERRASALSLLSLFAGIVAAIVWLVVGRFVLPVAVEPKREFLLLFAVCLSFAVATRGYLRRSARRALLPAMVVSAQADRMVVQLASPKARASKPKSFVGAPASMMTSGVGWFCVVQLALIIVLAAMWSGVHRSVMLRGASGYFVVVDHSAAYRVEGEGNKLLVRAGAHRLEFVGLEAVEPIALPAGFGDVSVDLTPPDCGESSEGRAPSPLAWSSVPDSPTPTYRRECERR
ncbi:MAG: hypothetical protein JNK05_35780 [Myxococcales bacterium]|nr:hypothetical protein [Myxococcales bacterium]